MTFPDAETGDIANFKGWLEHRNNAGTAFHYCTGMWLDQRRANKSSEYILSEAERKLANTAWNAYLDGKVFLVQRREGSAKFAYLAVKRHTPAKPEPLPTLRGRINSDQPSGRSLSSC